MKAIPWITEACLLSKDTFCSQKLCVKSKIKKKKAHHDDYIRESPIHTVTVISFIFKTLLTKTAEASLLSKKTSRSQKLFWPHCVNQRKRINSNVSFIPYFGFWYFGHFSCRIFFPVFSVLHILPCKM